MTRIFIFLLFILLLPNAVSAQGLKANTSEGFLYTSEKALVLLAHTHRGMGVGYEVGRMRTYYKTTFFFVNGSEIKHPKEHRQSADPSLNRAFRPFVFGKQNNLLAIRAGWGLKRYYSEKARHKGVAIGLSYAVGPTLGVTKPYFLAIRRSSPDNPSNSRAIHEKYSEANKEVFLDNTRILGASPFTKGLSDVKIIPGGNASLALHIDWGSFDEFVKAIEIGAMLDVFPKKIPILISDYNNAMFLNFFVNLQFGKRK